MLHSVHSELNDRNYICQSALIQVYIFSPTLNIFNIFGSHYKKSIQAIVKANIK